MVFLYKFSFIFPICNEEKILKKQFNFFIDFLKKENIKNYEIILMENGSSDNSLKIIQGLAKEYTKIKFFHLEKASYGLTVKNALLVALGEYLVVLDIDFSDLNFLRNGLKEIKINQLIVGSKSLEKSSDNRPLADRLRTKSLNLIVRYVFKYPGTDTHGNKILKNSLLLKQIIWSCYAKYEFFDTELLIRLVKTKQYSLKELKTKIKEIRPSRYSLYRRFFLCLLDLMRLISCYIFKNKGFFESKISKFEINADDYGLDKNVNKIILAQKKARSIKRISVLANLVDKKDLFNLKRTNSFTFSEINLHFNLLRGKPISKPIEVSSLIDKNGYFFSLPKFLLKFIFFKISIKEIEKELAEQFNFLLKNNLIPMGIDSEQHLHTFYPIWPIVIKFAKRNKLQVRSVESTFFHLKKHPVKYLFWYYLNFIFIKKPKTNYSYNAIITHPGSNYD